MQAYGGLVNLRGVLRLRFGSVSSRDLLHPSYPSYSSSRLCWCLCWCVPNAGGIHRRYFQSLFGVCGERAQERFNIEGPTIHRRNGELDNPPPAACAARGAACGICMPGLRFGNGGGAPNRAAGSAAGKDRGWCGGGARPRAAFTACVVLSWPMRLASSGSQVAGTAETRR